MIFDGTPRVLSIFHSEGRTQVLTPKANVKVAIIPKLSCFLDEEAKCRDVVRGGSIGNAAHLLWAPLASDEWDGSGE